MLVGSVAISDVAPLESIVRELRELIAGHG
jgi:hypothetical protein